MEWRNMTINLDIMKMICPSNKSGWMCKDCPSGLIHDKRRSCEGTDFCPACVPVNLRGPQSEQDCVESHTHE
jgi:hypothetical protein